MAPEMLDRKTYGTAVDIWATGVCLYFMLSGKPPFFGDGRKQIFKSIKDNELTFPEEQWKNISPAC